MSGWARVAPHLFILLPAVFALLRDFRVETLGLAILAGAWHWFMVRFERPVAPAIYFVVILAIIGVLIRIDPLFIVTGVGWFIQAFERLPGWWAYAGVAAIAGVLVAARPNDGKSVTEIVFEFFVAMLVASAIGIVTQTIRDQNAYRKVMIAKLEALVEENASLQAQLLTQAREAGVLQERQRMAREIHDTIAQGLTGILTQLEAINGVAHARLDTVRTLARESLTEARRSVEALRPSPLDEAQLASALQGVVSKWSQTAGVPATVSVTGDPRPLHTEVEITLLRVAQEALANVGKHARATRVGVTLSYMEDVVVLDVRDDGAGFSGRSSQGGFGLIAMRQRVTRLAGSFEIETAPGAGTGISATVPALPAGS